MGGIVVFGASGFLGRHLLASLQGARAIGTFHQCARPGLEFLDLRSPQQIEALLCRLAPSVILYAAGLTNVDVCERDADLARRLNAEAAAEVAAWGRARTVYLSTDYVFDGARGSYSENDEATPVNVYGRTKLAGERAVLRRGQGNLVIRVSGLYDARGVKGRQFSNPRPAEVAEDVRVSSPVHVEDVVSAVRLLLDAGSDGVYHVAGPDALSRYEFWQLVALRFPAAASAQPSAAGPAPRPRDSSLRTRRVEVLGWRARRVCDALPALPPNRHPGIGHAPTLGDWGEGIEALLIDCVGGLLTRRAWLPRDSLLEEVDRACAAATNGAELWRTAATQSLGLGGAGLPALHERIGFRYAPNPPVWGRLPDWRRYYRLALVNNGPATTFRYWVRKYGLDHVFDVLANSEEMGVRKPAPEFFLRVAHQLGVAPGKCALLDDDPANVEGATRCGLRAILTIERGCFPLSVHAWDESAAGVDYLGERQ